MALNRSSRWLCICAVFAVCFILRAGVALLIDASVHVIKRADVYSDIAANLARGHGFVAEPEGEAILWRAPAYPAFLAVLYRLFGEHNETAVLLAQSALDSVTAVLILYIGTRQFDETIGCVSAVLFALHPLSAYYTLRFMPEPLFTLVLTAVIAAWIAAMHTRRPTAFMLVGALIAGAALVKPVALGLWPCLVAAACYGLRTQPKRALSVAMAMSIACLLLLAPWAIRNYRLTGQLVAVATGGGYALWLGNQTASEGREDWEVDAVTREHLDALRGAVLTKTEGSDRSLVSVSNHPAMPTATHPVHITVEEDRAFLQAAWQEIAQHPFESALLTVRKLYRFWFKIFLPNNRWAQSYIVVFQILCLGLTLLGMLQAESRKELWVVLLLPVLFLAAAHALTFSTLRYSIPTVPVMTVLMTTGLRALNTRWGLSLGSAGVRWLKLSPVGELAASYRRRPL